MSRWFQPVMRGVRAFFQDEVVLGCLFLVVVGLLMAFGVTGLKYVLTNSFRLWLAGWLFVSLPLALYSLGMLVDLKSRNRLLTVEGYTSISGPLLISAGLLLILFGRAGFFPDEAPASFRVMLVGRLGIALSLIGLFMWALGSPGFRKGFREMLEGFGDLFLMANDGTRLTMMQMLVAAMWTPVAALVGLICGTLGAAIALVGVVLFIGPAQAPEGFVYRSTGSEMPPGIFALLLGLGGLVIGVGVGLWLFITSAEYLGRIYVRTAHTDSPTFFGAITAVLAFIATIVLVIWFWPSIGSFLDSL